VEAAEDKLFHKMLTCQPRAVPAVAGPTRRTNCLRKRRHDQILTQHTTRHTDSNFITRQLFQNSYLHYFALTSVIFSYCNRMHPVISLLYEYVTMF